MAYPIIITGRVFNPEYTFNPHTPDHKTDGESVLCFSGPNLDATGIPLPVVLNDCTIDGATFRWGSKQSLLFDVTFNRCTFKNGTKRAFDMVRGGNVVFNNCKWVNDGTRKRVTSPYFSLSEQCDCGIKGGVGDILFNRCSINDVLLGDYTIYDQIPRPKTRRVTFNRCTNPNGGPVIVRGRYFDAKSITKIQTNVNAWTWPTLFTKLYWLYNKKFGDTRKPDGWNKILPQELD